MKNIYSAIKFQILSKATNIVTHKKSRWKIFILQSNVRFWVQIKRSNKLECYFVMDLKQLFWYLIHVEVKQFFSWSLTIWTYWGRKAWIVIKNWMYKLPAFNRCLETLTPIYRAPSHVIVDKLVVGRQWL